ncbi:MAG TPA: hypothetical protein EYN66_16790 [Myxococcales bacterium]|nr:hypothetical protein [Myxococcales bacterium]
MTLDLHKHIYSQDAIARAIQTFSDFGTFNVVADEDAVHTHIEIIAGDNVDEHELLGEFGNFVLADSIETERHGK